MLRIIYSFALILDTLVREAVTRRPFGPERLPWSVREWCLLVASVRHVYVHTERSMKGSLVVALFHLSTCNLVYTFTLFSVLTRKAKRNVRCALHMRCHLHLCPCSIFTWNNCESIRFSISKTILCESGCKPIFELGMLIHNCSVALLRVIKICYKNYL